MAASTSTSVYVPVRPQDDSAIALDLAIDYMGDHHLDPMIVIPEMSFLRSCPRLKSYAEGKRVITPRNDAQTHVPPGDSVLVYRPLIRELSLALRRAHGRPVVLVEDPTFSWEKWADEAQAWNLIEEHFHSVDRGEQHEHLLQMVDHAGNNGWSDPPGRRDLLRHLRELQDNGWLNRDEVIAYQLVKGHSGFGHSLTFLADQIDNLGEN